MIDEDHCVYVKRTSRKFLSLYVDDILIDGSDKEYLWTSKDGCPHILICKIWVK